MTGSLILSIIIPTLNRRALLAQTLQTLSTQDFPSDQFEVLVIVDGSSDGTLQILESLRPPFDLRVFSQANKGPASARNIGIQNAKGSVILFLDDDLVVGKNVLGAHAKAHEAAEDLVVIGRVLPHPDSPPSSALENLKSETEKFLKRFEEDGGLRFPEDSACETNTSVRRIHLEAVEGYDERFYLQRENEELGYRLYRKGLRYVYLPQALVRHYYFKTDEDLIRNSYWSGRNYVLFLQKHPECRIPSSLDKLFDAPWPERILGRGLWASARPLGGLLGWVAKTAGVFYPPVNRTDGALSKARRFCRYSQGVKAAGWTLQDFKQNLKPRFPIFIYHALSDSGSDVPPLCPISRLKFARQMKVLYDRGYRTITLKDWMNWLRQGTSLPPKPFILTFDDGYRSVYTHAFPILRQYRFRAMVFLPSFYVGKTNRWDEEKGFASLPLLCADEIREMQNYGISFGSHGKTHRLLVGLDIAEAKREIEESKASLESLLGLPVEFFAYPWGESDETARRLVREAGYLGALSSFETFVSEASNLFALPRIGMDNTVSQFAFRLQLWLEKSLEEIPSRKSRSMLRKVRNALLP